MKNNLKDIIIVILIVAIVFVVFFNMQQTPKETIKTVTKYQCQNGQTVDSADLCPKIVEKPLVHATINRWARNQDNLNEILFDVDVYNYDKNIEAKNLVVTCKAFEADTTGKVKDYHYPILTVDKNIGNVASGSYTLKEITVTNTEIQTDKSIGICSITACDNCEEIITRIPELQQYYTEAGFKFP